MKQPREAVLFNLLCLNPSMGGLSIGVFLSSINLKYLHCYYFYQRKWRISAI